MKTITYLLLISLLLVSCKKEKIVFIADHYGDCDTQCLLVRENENDNWIEFNNQIENFDYQEGYTYQLKISVTKEDSKLKYRLVEVLSKIKTEVTSKIIEKKWYITSIKGFSNKTNKVPYFLINNGKITGNTGCNDFGGELNYKSGNFKISQLKQTEMYCEEYASLEKAVNKSLSQAAFYKISDGLLFILDQSKYVLLTAKDSDARHISQQHSYIPPYIIKYSYITQENSKREISIEEIKNSMIITDIADTKTSKTKTLTKSELKFFNDYFENLDFNQLEKITPLDNPKNGASLSIFYHGKTHEILDFDRITPPKQLRKLIDMLKELADK